MEVILFGYGRAGKIHYKNIIDNPKFKLTHIIDAKDISQEINSTINLIYDWEYEKINHVLKNDSIKAIIVATPTKTHYQIIKKGLSNNKHIFVEKPIADDLDQINECFNLADKNNLILFVGYVRRFDPTIEKIKNQINNNQIGKLNYALTISRDYPYPQPEFLKICSGIFHDCATHDIDYLNWIINDRPISVYVSVENNNQVTDYNYEHVLINLNYLSGLIASINLSRISQNYDQRCEFYGDKGEIINNIYDPRSQFSFPERYHQAFKKEIEEFYLCIKKDKKPIVSKNDCVCNFIIAEACHQSVDQNKKITIKYTIDNKFRNYEIISYEVKENYKLARTNQTFDFVNKMKLKFSNLNTKLNIWEILEKLNYLTDVSDPDSSHPNLYHAIQTAEMIKRDNHPDWMQLIGLIHDLGKIMYLKGNDQDGTGMKKQWAMVGDTFIVGCKLPDQLIFPEFNRLNPDMNNKTYNTKNGIYKSNCGLDNLQCTWGHDEYLYQILTDSKNPNRFPEEALYIIRYHSLYAYHDKSEYYHFRSEKDIKLFPILKTFNQYDLYSKSDLIFSIEELKPYYINLINKFFINPYLFI